MVSSAEFIEAMRHFPGAVNVITTGEGDARAGFTATAVMSLTAEPPQVAVAVNKTVSGLPALRANGTFCISTLASHHAEIASRFAGKVKGLERFETGEWTTLETGAPILADGIINLDCRTVQEIEFSSHILLVGRVEAVLRNVGLKPLLYMEGDWASLLPGPNFGLNVYMDAVRSTVGIIEKAEVENRAPDRQLDSMIRHLTRYYIDQQSVTRDQLSSEQYVSPDQLADLNAARKVFDDKVIELLARGNSEGSFDIDDLRLTAFAISGMVAWVHRWFRPSGRLTPDEIGERLALLVNRMVSAGTIDASYDRKVAAPRT